MHRVGSGAVCDDSNNFRFPPRRRDMGHSQSLAVKILNFTQKMFIITPRDRSTVNVYMQDAVKSTARLHGVDKMLVR